MNGHREDPQVIKDTYHHLLMTKRVDTLFESIRSRINFCNLLQNVPYYSM